MELASRKKVALKPVTTPSWWTLARRESFTQVATSKVPEMSVGKFGQLRVVDFLMGEEKGWGWPKKTASEGSGDDEA